MPEAGGPATQAGIYYQNSITALALLELLDLDQRIARERLVEVRVEAPNYVDDLVLLYADGHRDFQTIKLSVQLGNDAWASIWRSLDQQRQSNFFGRDDQLTIMVAERNATSEAVQGLCERAAASIDAEELRGRLNRAQRDVLDSIDAILPAEDTFELLRRCRLVHNAPAEIEQEVARRRAAGEVDAGPTLFALLRDMAGGEARRRGLFRAGPLRQRLKTEHEVLLPEPAAWGLAAYRATIRRLSRIEIPGLGITRPARELFVWPRARLFDRDRQTDFEDEEPDERFDRDEQWLDLQAFPSPDLHRIVVVAGPGYGKSALLTALADQLVDGPVVPVHVPLASLASADSSIIDFLGTSISRDLDVRPDWQLLADQGLLAVLLDGLDEVPARERPRLLERIANFSARYPSAPWILTVRDAAVVSGLPEATMVELTSLSDEDVERFALTMKDRLGDLRSWELVRRLNLYPDLDRLARIPLFLVMLLATTDLGGVDHGAMRRSDLLELYLRTLFSPEEHKPLRRSPVSPAMLARVAETLAFERLERQEIGATERDVRLLVARFASDAEAADELYGRLLANGILKRQSAVRLQFPYPIVQEYLAARHIVDHFPETLEARIGDAIQRPWAQVIQFALELHPEPEPVMRAMLDQADDAFCTGLRLIGRCIANGARVTPAFRNEIGDRLVDFWVHAPTRARERVGRLLADGFTDPPVPTLEAALHHRWLIEHGAGDILSRLGDTALTCRVFANLLRNDRSSFMIWHSLKPALRAAGVAALDTLIAVLDPSTRAAAELDKISSAFSNLDGAVLPRDRLLATARDERLPAQARLRAFRIAGPPLEDDAIALTRTSLARPNWDSRYEAAYLVELHGDAAVFLVELLRDEALPLKRRTDLAARVLSILPDPAERAAFLRTHVAEATLDPEIVLTLRLFAARFGDRAIFEGLIEELGSLPRKHAATTISLFGHYSIRELGEQAAAIIGARDVGSEDVRQLASSAVMGMRYVYEMDSGFGGILRSAPPHPATHAWRSLLERWMARSDLSWHDRLQLLSSASELGSDVAMDDLEREILAINDFDAPELVRHDKEGNLLGSAIRRLQRRRPVLPPDLVERLLASRRYNVASDGVRALEAQGDDAALERLLELHASESEWLLRDLAANTIELLAARLGLRVVNDGGRYRRAPAE